MFISKRGVLRSSTAWRLAVGITLLALFVPACGMLNAADQTLQETVVALETQQTSLAQTITAQSQKAQQATAPQPSPSAMAPEATQPPPATPTAEAQIASPTSAEPAPAPTQAPTNPDEALERWMSTAKILLFEDMSGSREIRLVKEALDKAGYFYLDVGSAKGWFKTQLLSPEDWDLVIAAAEARRNFGGEYFEYINDRIDQGSSSVIEFWDLDAAPMGQALPLLDRCGIEFQADWYEPDLRTFYWLQPEHPVFNEPNEIPSLRNAIPIWKGDIGDLMEVRFNGDQPTGDALMLAGTNPSWTEDHSTLVTCVDGRLILQTFGSHEYRREDIVPLWQNYIYNALKSRYEYLEAQATPAAAPQSTPVLVPTAQAISIAGIGEEASCGWALTAQVPSLPLYIKDLFEHHAKGTFLILDLQLVNQSDQAVQIWDGDYFVEGNLGDSPVTYRPDKAATGYLYIENPSHLYQDKVQPGVVWRTTMAFDVDPAAKDLSFVLKPGSEVGEQMCEVRFVLDR